MTRIPESSFDRFVQSFDLLQKKGNSLEEILEQFRIRENGTLRKKNFFIHILQKILGITQCVQFSRALSTWTTEIQNGSCSSSILLDQGKIMPALQIIRGIQEKIEKKRGGSESKREQLREQIAAFEQWTLPRSLSLMSKTNKGEGKGDEPKTEVTSPPNQPKTEVTNPPNQPINEVTNPPKEPINEVSGDREKKKGEPPPRLTKQIFDLRKLLPEEPSPWIVNYDVAQSALTTSFSSEGASRDLTIILGETFDASSWQEDLVLLDPRPNEYSFSLYDNIFIVDLDKIHTLALLFADTKKLQLSPHPDFPCHWWSCEKSISLSFHAKIPFDELFPKNARRIEVKGIKNKEIYILTFSEKEEEKTVTITLDEDPDGEWQGLPEEEQEVKLLKRLNHRFDPDALSHHLTLFGAEVSIKEEEERHFSLSFPSITVHPALSENIAFLVKADIPFSLSLFDELLEDLSSDYGIDYKVDKRALSLDHERLPSPGKETKKVFKIDREYDPSRCFWNMVYDVEAEDVFLLELHLYDLHAEFTQSMRFSSVILQFSDVEKTISLHPENWLNGIAESGGVIRANSFLLPYQDEIKFIYDDSIDRIQMIASSRFLGTKLESGATTFYFYDLTGKTECFSFSNEEKEVVFSLAKRYRFAVDLEKKPMIWVQIAKEHYYYYCYEENKFKKGSFDVSEPNSMNSEEILNKIDDFLTRPQKKLQGRQTPPNRKTRRPELQKARSLNLSTNQTRRKSFYG